MVLGFGKIYRPILQLFHMFYGMVVDLIQFLVPKRAQTEVPSKFRPLSAKTYLCRLVKRTILRLPRVSDSSLNGNNDAL